MSGCDGHSHDHEHAEPDDTNASLGASLRPHIDFSGVQCLNESRQNSGRDILKLYENRLSSAPALLSQEDPDEDPELLLIVPFAEAVTMKSLSVMSHADAPDRDVTAVATAAPRTLRVYANRPNLDFETVRDLAPTATLSLVPPSHQFSDEHGAGAGVGTVDYPLRPAGRFQNVSEIALYFCDNHAMPEGSGGSNDMDDTDEDRIQTEITYVGFKGKGTNMRRNAVEAVYETQGMKKDHKVPGSEYYGREGL
mmetsp:Transcript_10257/g.22188  ORF Transcript_10257/g.22188 Transcript_10257/m.22188 type:complete len:252 (+) Transcript_10257:144-899(+)|eukprot:CAMPEP_0172536350 /NCGR_PEP_ID=MMETSP1067-20121228/8122_1 /TAXON_ID=265564 ORGANISM="Thalassiosira punctigera, Strain Tpunct2005C2" /NCGR_SAMPLE_ID=MMETSP1067 /ASSEMBLY_ACC=CAM_ASM_000444 /LENGTH=251 /DNA_ID=CAMNT_0013321407 /DNA_START=121 /DNA_END=876 /DNA_ORIENTATION=-